MKTTADLKKQSRYNEYINGLMIQLEDLLPELGVYARLLAMETDYKEWTKQRLQKEGPVYQSFITDEMLALASDEQVAAVIEMKKEIWNLLMHLGDYWLTTAEGKSEMN